MKNTNKTLGTVGTLDDVDLKIGGPIPEEFKAGWRRDPSCRWLPTMFRWRHRDDDDDDPSPCPAVIAPLPRLPLFGAEVELEAA